MDTYEVLVVGGGPAGSSCARRLARRGVSVAVLDRAQVPRDKVCAGWITPAVVSALDLDLEDYARTLTLQAFTGFRTGPFDGPLRLVDFGRPISYGIRRCEFDRYLLERSGAELLAAAPLKTMRREGAVWIVNETIRARVVVGAGGHFCPVARQLNPGLREEVVAAQEVEFRVDPADPVARSVAGESPDLFFWPDLMGYGWTVRKGDYLNVGVGRLAPSEFPAAVRQFTSMLRARGLWPLTDPGPWKGHAYLLNRTSRRRVFGDGVLLAGDAAGLALAPSGEGILAAVESGQMAGDAILAAAPGYSIERLRAYGAAIDRRFAPRGKPSSLAKMPGWMTTIASRALFASPWLTRRILIEDGFLHVRREGLGARGFAQAAGDRPQGGQFVL